MTWDDVRALAKTLPGVEDGTYHGFACLRVAGKFLTRRSDDGDSVVLKEVPFDERELLVASEPRTYHLTTHQNARDTVLARMSTLDPGHLRTLLERRWRKVAPKAMVKAYDAARR
jgi:hypothetical protein